MISLGRLGLLNRRSPWRFVCASKRLLYLPSSLGLDVFNIQRQKAQKLIRNIPRLKSQLKQISENDTKGPVLLEDLKKMLGIAQGEEDLNLLLSLLRKYTRQKSVVLFQEYSVGPEIMRLLYTMNKPEEALKLIKDEDLFPQFKQTKTLLLLLDLLFKNGQYNDVVAVYEYYQQRVNVFSLIGRTSTIFLAACYKLNTESSFEKAVQVYKLCIKGKDINPGVQIYKRVPLRTSLIFAALAIKQNEPVCALEALYSKGINSCLENLKYMAFAQAKRFHEIFVRIREILNDDSLDQFFLTRDAVSFIEEEFMKDKCNKEYELEFQQFKSEINAAGIIIDQSIDKFLLSEVYPMMDERKRFTTQRTEAEEQ